MTTRDKDKVKVLINEAKVWVDSHSDNTGYWYTDDKGRQVPARYLTTEAIKRMLENLKIQLLKDDITDEFDGIENHLRECPYCKGNNSKVHINPGDGKYYPASAYVECLDCGTRGREFEGNNIDDIVLRATVAWNRRL